MQRRAKMHLLERTVLCRDVAARAWLVARALVVGSVLSALVVLAACGGPPAAPTLTLTLEPASVELVPGGAADVSVTVAGANQPANLSVLDLPAGVSATIDPNPTATSSVMRLSASVDAAAGSTGARVRATSGASSATAALSVVVLDGTEVGFDPATEPSPLTLRFDAFFYGDGDSATLTLDVGDLAPPTGPLTVALAAPGGSDTELVELDFDGGSRFVSAPLPLARLGAAPEPLDGVLELAPGSQVFALFFPEGEAFASVAEGAVFALALFEAEGGADVAVTVEPDVAASEGETTPPPGGKVVGTLVTEDGYPVVIATEELILYPRDAAQLAAFLERSGGTVLSMLEGFVDDEPDAYLIALEPPTADLDRLAALRRLVGESGAMLVSHQGAADLYFLALLYQLEGYPVAVNPRLAFQAPPAISPVETANAGPIMAMLPGGCLPGDDDPRCVANVPALWAYASLMDADTRRIPVAFLDIGFAPNADFRERSEGGFVECDMTAGGVLGGYECGPGRATGSPTVGNSFFGPRSWHGTGVVSTAGARVNDGFGVAGTGGQVVVPMLYKYDLAAYAFEMGLGMRKATDDGAACINISGGYPCRILTTVGPDFSICTAGGRAEICALITAAAHAAAATICATLGPLTFGIACAAATGTATAATVACVSSLAFGDVMGPMGQGAAYAYRSGVPVVVSAGNRLTPAALPPVLRDWVDLSVIDSDAWQVVPAVFPTTISVGAVDAAMRNQHFVGDSVDVWAPIPSRYLAPDDVDDLGSALALWDIGGTSAAAPYVTGVIAVMQALNPTLDPTNPALNDAQRRGIVERVRALLTADANSLTNADLVAQGYANEPARRRVIDPLRAARAAAVDLDPAFDHLALGFDANLNFDESTTASDDDPANATPLAFDEVVTGTIVTIRGDGIADPPPDVDWYRVSMPSASPGRVRRTTFTLEWPRDPASHALVLDGTTVRQVGATGQSRTYELLAEQGSTPRVRVSGGTMNDNVYRLSASAPTLASPSVALVAPDPAETLCVGQPVTFQADVGYPNWPSLSVPDAEIRWIVSGQGGFAGSGPSAVYTFTSEGTYQVTVQAFLTSALSDARSYTVVDCVGEPPTVTITAPASDTTGEGSPYVLDGFDEDLGLAYAELTLTALATDPEDGVLTGEALVWRTDQVGLHGGEGLLGTGATLVARLYGDYCSSGIGQHTVTVTATDSDGNVAVATRRIFVWTLC